MSKACVLGRFGDARVSHAVTLMYARVAESIVVILGVQGVQWLGPCGHAVRDHGRTAYD